MGFYEKFAAHGKMVRERAHTRILKRPKAMYFRCSCGCEFETDIPFCKKTVYGEYSTEISYSSHCPICGTECSSIGAKR